MSNLTATLGGSNQPSCPQLTGTSKSDFLAAEEIKGILSGRDKTEQGRILRWVTESLGLPVGTTQVTTPEHPTGALPGTTPHVIQHTGGASANIRSKDIKAFTQEKQPKSDVQFSAVVAYYHRFETAEAHRKETITPQDLQEATRLAGWSRFRTPSIPLNNAVRQGYFDRADRGEFKLNAVGENLVAMALPGSGEDAVNSHSSRPRTRRPKGKVESLKVVKRTKA